MYSRQGGAITRPGSEHPMSTATFRPSPLVARALRDLGLFASDTALATAWATATVLASSTFARSRYERAAREALCVALASGDLAAAERAAMLLADDGAAMQAAAAEAREAYEAQRAATRAADEAHAAEIARRRGTTPAVEARVAVEAPVAAPCYVECPCCHGHGDVPGEHSRHNPTGLVECPVCRGEREVLAESDDAPATNDNAARAQVDAIDGAETIWRDLLDGDLTLDQSLPCERGYEVAS